MSYPPGRGQSLTRLFAGHSRYPHSCWLTSRMDVCAMDQSKCAHSGWNYSSKNWFHPWCMSWIMDGSSRWSKNISYMWHFRMSGKGRNLRFKMSSGWLSVETRFIISPEQEAPEILWGGSRQQILLGLEWHCLYQQNDQHHLEPVTHYDVQMVCSFGSHICPSCGCRLPIGPWQSPEEYLDDACLDHTRASCSKDDPIIWLQLEFIPQWYSFQS